MALTKFQAIQERIKTNPISTQKSVAPTPTASTTVSRPVAKIPTPANPVVQTAPQTITRNVAPTTPKPVVPNTFGDLGGATNVQAKPIDFKQQTFQAPDVFTFGQGATQKEQQQAGYLTQRNNFLAQDLLNKGVQDTASIFESLSQQYGDFANADILDRQNTATAITNRIAQMQQEKQAEEKKQQESIEEYKTRIQGEAQAAAGQAQQDMLQERQRAGVVGQDRPLENLNRDKTLQQQAIDRSLEQTKFSINNQIENVVQEAQRNLDMGDKIGALKGFNRSGGYISGLKNIRDDADKAVSRLQQQLAFAEQYAGEDKEQIIDDFNKSVSRVHEDFAYQTRSLRENATINLKEISSKYGLSDEKMAVELEKVAFSFSQQAEQLVGQYIANTRNAIQVTNDQIDVLSNYDKYLEQQTERFTNVINMDDGAALSTMTRNDIDTASKDGRLLPEQAVAYKQLMVGKAVNTLSSLGIPSQEDVRNLMTQIQGGISPAAALMQIVGSNPDRYTQQENKFMTVGKDSMVFDTVTKQFVNAPQGTTQSNYQGPDIPPATPENLSQSFSKYANMSDGSKVRSGQCGEFVNDYLKDMGVAMKFVDPIDVRATQTNSDTPTKGSVVVMTSNSSDLAAKYGHVGIVTNVNADGSFTIKDQNGKNKLAVGTMTIPAGDPRVKGFFDPQLGLSKGQGGQGASEMDALNFENYVMNFVPQQDRGSDKEKERITNYVQKAMQSGMTAEEAGLAYRGFRIQDKGNIDQAMEYMGVLNNLPKFPDGGARIVSDFINKGDTTGADRYIANKVDEAVQGRHGTNAIMTSSIKSQGNMVNRINSLVKDNKANIGAFDGRIADFKKKFSSTPAVQELDTLLTMLQAETRKNFAGSSVTPSEMQALQDFVGGNKKMNGKNLLTMINTIYNKVNNEYNLQRQDYGYSPTKNGMKIIQSLIDKGNEFANQSKQPTTTNTPTRKKADDLLNSYGL